MMYKEGVLDSAPDGVSGAGHTYSWDLSTNQVIIVTRHSSTIGGSPLTLRGRVVRSSESQVTFLVEYESGVELHSIYPKAKVNFISPHKEWSKQGRLAQSASIFTGRCELTVE